MSYDLSKQKIIDTLIPRREPYWSRVTAGLYVGYRKPSQGDGSWIARRYGEDKKQEYRALAAAQSYDEARRLATRWASGLDKGIVFSDSTVEGVCRDYVAHLAVAKTARSAQDADGRFSRLVYGKLIGSVLLEKLDATAVRKWLHSQVSKGDDEEVRRSKDSANRNLASFKAALNHARTDNRVMDDAGWKPVKPFKGVGARRTVMLTRQDRRALFEAMDEDLRNLATALLFTGARPGEIAAADVCDIDRQQGVLTLDGKTGKREVTLSTPARVFFSELIKGRIANAPLLVKAYGARWTKDCWKKPFKTAVKAAGLPAVTVMYAIRHAAISEMVAQKISIFQVAKMTGTSTAMIDKHYGHLRHDDNRAKLDAVNLI